MKANVTGVILSGGRSTRMGGQDKGLMLLNGEPLYQHVLKRLQPQVSTVIISANRHQDRYQRSGCQVIGDSLDDYPGPLAGMLAALQNIETEWAAFTACDTPFIPADYVARLWQAKAEAPIVWVKSTQRDHPMLSLINRRCVDELLHFLQQGERKVMHFMRQQGGHAVEFTEEEQVFMNVNTAEELRMAGEL